MQCRFSVFPASCPPFFLKFHQKLGQFLPHLKQAARVLQTEICCLKVASAFQGCWRDQPPSPTQGHLFTCPGNGKDVGGTELAGGYIYISFFFEILFSIELVLQNKKKKIHVGKHRCLNELMLLMLNEYILLGREGITKLRQQAQPGFLSLQHMYGASGWSESGWPPESDISNVAPSKQVDWLVHMIGISSCLFHVLVQCALGWVAPYTGCVSPGGTASG